MNGRHEDCGGAADGIIIVAMAALIAAFVLHAVGCAAIPEPGAELDELLSGIPATPAAPEDAIDLAGPITVFEADSACLKWPATVRLTQIQIGGMVSWVTDPERRPWKDVNGCDGCIWLFLKRPDGSWYASPGDHIRTGNNTKPRGDIKIWNGAEVLRPRSGEQIGIMLSTRCRHSNYPNGQERSTVMLVEWP